jgi:FKBP-type peptidyl-prolyl cis-trans isomerase
MKIFTSIIVIIVVIAVGVFAFKKAPSKQVETSTDDTSLPANTTTEGETTTPTENTSTSMDTNKRTLANFTPVAKTETLEKTDLVVGTGKVVEAGATVSVHYTGAVAATGVVFQSSKDFGTAPITFPLNQVIKGWTDGIPGMKVGGTRRLVIPAAQAYGSNPPPGSGIPANADLVFDVELVDVQ